jgi:hypothetical protein
MDLWGIENTNLLVGALQDQTNVTVYGSDGTTTGFTLDAGTFTVINTGKGIEQGIGQALHVVSDKPVGAIQVADGDGWEAASLFETRHLNKYFGIPLDTQYIAIACPYPDTSITLFNPPSSPQVQTCSGDGLFPGKAYFGNTDNNTHISAGAYLESTEPIYLVYESSASNDEHNLLGLMDGQPAPPPPPEPLESYQIKANQSDGSNFIINGAAGSLDVTHTIHITNTRTGENLVIAPQADGSFSGSINAQVGDGLSVIVFDSLGNPSTTTVIYAGAVTIKNPYTAGGYWYTGQAHTHTTMSDGVDSPQELEAAYFDAGYDFLVSTDHRGTSPFFTLPEHGRTLDPDNSATGKDLLWIRGSELGFGSLHMGAWGQDAYTSFTTPPVQQQIDEVRSNNGIVVANHPAHPWPGLAWGWTDELKTFSRYSLIEAFNGKERETENGLEEVDHRRDAIDLADEYIQVWWIGADDCHNISSPSQFDHYAIVVKTDSPAINETDLMSSADSGNFYIRESGSGPEIISVDVTDNTITITMADIASDYSVTWKMRGDEITQQDLNVNSTASYMALGNEGYIHAVVERTSDGKRAYTQPLFITNNTDLSVSAAVSEGTSAASLLDNAAATYWDAGAGAGSFVIDTGTAQLLNAIKIDWYDGDSRPFRTDHRRIRRSHTLYKGNCHVTVRWER